MRPIKHFFEYFSVVHCLCISKYTSHLHLTFVVFRQRTTRATRTQHSIRPSTPPQTTSSNPVNADNRIMDKKKTFWMVMS